MHFKNRKYYQTEISKSSIGATPLMSGQILMVSRAALFCWMLILAFDEQHIFDSLGELMTRKVGFVFGGCDKFTQRRE